MKSFKQYIFEAKKISRPSRGERYIKFLDVLRTPEYAKHDDSTAGGGIWTMFGHGAKDIESVKRRVFGNNLAKKKPEIFWYHRDKGIITHPAHADKNLTHDTIERDLIYGPSLTSSLRKIIDPKVVSEIGAVKNIVGRGRIEHRDDGTGFITYSHIGGVPETAVVRTLQRRHPNYMILNSSGKML